MNSSSQTQTLAVLGMILIFCGVLLLAFGGYLYAAENYTATEVVPTDVTVGARGISIPIWGGLACIAAGAALLVIPHYKGRPLDRSTPHR